MRSKYSGLYGRRWRKRAKAQLSKEPLCAICLRDGQIVEATVADHVVPHRGDYELFWSGALQSLCEAHHNSHKQRIEKRGYDNACDIHGRPLDPNHPSNKVDY